MNIIHVPSGSEKLMIGGIYSVPLSESITFKRDRFRLKDTFIVCCVGFIPAFIGRFGLPEIAA